MASVSCENSDLRLWTRPGYSQSFSSFEMEKLGKVNSVSLPFFYWTAQNRDNLPENANVFDYGNYPLGKPSPDCDNADISGLLRIPVSESESDDFWDSLSRNKWSDLISRVDQIVKLIEQKQGYSSLFFKTFIPFSTRHAKDTLKSLFPFTGIGRTLLAGRGHQSNIISGIIIGLPLLIIDIATLAFRFIALIPRAIYQHVLQKKSYLPQVAIATNSSDNYIDWSQGTIIFHAFKTIDSKSIRDQSRVVYLG